MPDFGVLELQNTLYTSHNPMRRWLHQSRYSWIADQLERAPTASRAAAAEIGPGSGVYLRLLVEQFQQVVAVDVEDAFLESARRIGAGECRLATLKADITQPGALPEAAFDLILCTEVVEHLEPGRTPDALVAMRRALKPGGVLILTTPQRNSTLEATARIALSPVGIGLTRLIYNEPVNELGHINLMTAPELKRDLDAAGFAILDEALIGLYLPVLGELGGEAAVKLGRRLEPALRSSILSGLLWTQCYLVGAA